MRRIALAAAVLAILLGGCPLPQPLDESYDASAVLPPRILPDAVSPAGTRVLVGRSCPGAGVFAITARVRSPDSTHPVEARWFVDYDSSSNAGVYKVEQLSVAGSAFEGDATFRFQLPPYDGSRAVHVVEVVVSNGFMAIGDTSAPLLNRSARTGFETQVFRWVFEYAASDGACGEAPP